MKNVFMVVQPKMSTSSLLNKSAFIAGCIVGTSKRVATVSGAIIKHDYNEMIINLKNF